MSRQDSGRQGNGTCYNHIAAAGDRACVCVLLQTVCRLNSYFEAHKQRSTAACVGFNYPPVRKVNGALNPSLQALPAAPCHYYILGNTSRTATQGTGAKVLQVLMESEEPHQGISKGWELWLCSKAASS